MSPFEGLSKGLFWAIPLLLVGALLYAVLTGGGGGSTRSTPGKTGGGDASAQYSWQFTATATSRAVQAIATATAVRQAAITATPPRANTLPPAATRTPEPLASPTRTRTHTPRPTATRAPDAQVSHSSLNLRAGPGDEYAVLRNYPQRTAVSLTGKSADGRWMQVRTPDGRTGWMWADYLRINISLGQVPVVSAPTSPLEGKAVKGSGKPVYLIEGGRRRWFPNSQSFEQWASARGLGWGDIVDYANEPSKWNSVRALSCGEPMPHSYTIVEGTLVQAEGSAEVYEMRIDSAGRQVKARVSGNIDWNQVACVARGWLERY